MKIINNILYIEYDELVKNPKRGTTGVLPLSQYNNWQVRGKLVQLGRGGNGNQVLTKYEDLPTVAKTLLQERFGNPYEYVAKQPIRDLIQPCEKDRQFFEDFVKSNGKNLEYQEKAAYCNNAAILRAFATLLANKKQLKQTLHISIGTFWQKACEIVTDVQPQFPNTLPTSERRLKPLYNAFVKSGFDCAALIDGRKFNETNNRVVDDEFEWLIMSLFVQSHKPYMNEVHADYLRFLRGEVSVVDTRGKFEFNPADYQCYGELSDTTMWRILNKPINKAVIDKLRLNALDYSNRHLPYNERFSPLFSLSKISIDDLEVQFKLPEGGRVAAYEAADATSECIIGAAFGRKANSDLIVECLKDMFRLLVANNCGIPAEIEFERALTQPLEDNILKAGNLFPFTRLCRAGNPREKKIEQVFRRKRYSGALKKEKGYQGRPFARDDANRVNERSTATRKYDDIVAIERYAIEQWNHSLHSKQDKYPGMTRWEVFISNINPDLAQLKRHLIAQYIGETTTTTIRNNKVLRVQHANYWLPSPESIALFDTYSVTAYYLRDADGTIPEVYVYQNGEYKCTCTKALKYNESLFEQTDEDKAIMHKQFGYRSKFDAMVKQRTSELARVKVLAGTNDTADVVEDVKPITLPVFNEPVKKKINYSQLAEDDL